MSFGRAGNRAFHNGFHTTGCSAASQCFADELDHDDARLNGDGEERHIPMMTAVVMECPSAHCRKIPPTNANGADNMMSELSATE